MSYFFYNNCFNTYYMLNVNYRFNHFLKTQISEKCGANLLESYAFEKIGHCSKFVISASGRLEAAM